MDPRTQILSALRRSHDGLTVTHLASLIGTHPNTIRHHLQVLTDDGLIEASKIPTHGRGRPQWRYVTTAKSVGVGQRDYPLLASLLLDLVADDPETPRKTRELGRHVGATMVAAGQSHLDVWNDLGFEPVDCGDVVELRHCPYLEAAQQAPDVVCALHEGLLEGTTPEGSSVELRPFARDGVCHVHISTER